MMLTEDEIREKIKQYCHESDGCDLAMAINLENRIVALCEVLGTNVHSLGRDMLESVGIEVRQVDPEWIFD